MLHVAAPASDDSSGTSRPEKDVRRRAYAYEPSEIVGGHMSPWALVYISSLTSHASIGIDGQYSHGVGIYTMGRCREHVLNC
mmetsp:Transcript_132751/g.331179  ORF Transcript_132751/g.331179 Transcript_132751/m.331179 type:complete len:82 (-) Transcript_132751:177-422(-)